MSLIGGGPDCSAGANPLANLSKHAQHDRLLQHSAAMGQPFQAPASAMHQQRGMNAADMAGMEQFQRGGAGPALSNFSPMHRELAAMQPAPQQPQAAGWSNEFRLQPAPQMAGMAPQLHGWQEQFAREVHTPQQQMLAAPMMGSSMGMGGYQRFGGFSQVGHGPMMGALQQKIEEVDDLVWELRFREMEAATAEATASAQATEEATAQAELEEIVVDDKDKATFQEVWDLLNLEVFQNEFLKSQADMPLWEKDFAQYAQTRAHFGEYQFEKENEFSQMDDPYAIGMRLMESGAKLLEAALAFEAAIERNPEHVDAWLRLGEVQTQNEKELAGIAALERCLELDAQNLLAMMTLAVLYINEGYDNAAFATLERWIETKYPQVAERARAANPKINDEDRFLLNRRVTELFLQAAQLLPGQANMDADVQMGLGVLFYANEEFSKTIDCFRAALRVRPDDALLWNRLGALLANSNRSEEAVDAYFKALELRPAFVRARYNLGVSCINIGCYKEAAEHLLGGLSMHAVDGVEQSMDIKNQSTSLLETLKRAFIAMDRRDLVEVVRPGMDLTQFRGEFDF